MTDETNKSIMADIAKSFKKQFPDKKIVRFPFGNLFSSSSSSESVDKE